MNHQTIIGVAIFILLMTAIGFCILKTADAEDDPSPSTGNVTLIGYAPHYIEKTKTLGIDALVQEIIRRESGGDPTAKNPNSTAYGLCQFIDGTWQYVQNKWNMTLVRDDPEDQYYACKRLLQEEGISHWNESGPY